MWEAPLLIQIALPPQRETTENYNLGKKVKLIVQSQAVRTEDFEQNVWLFNSELLATPYFWGSFLLAAL